MKFQRKGGVTSCLVYIIYSSWVSFKGGGGGGGMPPPPPNETLQLHNSYVVKAVLAADW